ncbi:unnamed protein product, partial [Oppiella nova]
MEYSMTHKTGSTSVQNILFRYGDTHGLTIAVPPTEGYLGHPEFKRSLLPKLINPETGQQISYNIITNHMRFNYEEVKALMPFNTKYITLLRNPNQLFESLFHYYNLAKHLNYTSYDNFVTHLETNTTIGKSFKLNLRYNRRLGRNQMSFDLGLNITQFDDMSAIYRFIKKLDDIFDLVLITERMDESLVLLRHELCWTIRDVISFKLNARKQQKSIESINKNIHKILRLNRADHMLYNHFYKVFEKKVQDFGFERMKSELKLLKEETNYLYDECVDQNTLLSDILPKHLYYSPDISRLKPKANSDDICEQLTAIEGFYIDVIRQKQNYLYEKSLRKDK